MVEELLRAFAGREQVQEQIVDLKQLARQGKISREHYARLRRDYKKRLASLESEISDIKGRIGSQVAVFQATLSAYDGQTRKLSEAYARGALSLKEYQRRLKDVEQERDEYAHRQGIHEQEALLKTEKAADVSAWMHTHGNMVRPENRESASTDRSNGIIHLLRLATGAAALVLLASLLLPFFSGSVGHYIRPGNSLFQAALALRIDYPALTLLAAGPAIVAVLAWVACLIRTHLLRGMLLLALMTFAIAAIGACASLLLYYPHPLLSEAAAALDILSSAEIGLPVFLGALGILHLLALAAILGNRVGLILWLLSPSLSVLIFAGTAFVCAYSLYSDAEIAFEAFEDNSNDVSNNNAAQLRVSVVNRGNVPLYLMDSLSRHASRNAYEMVFEQRESDNPWEAANPDASEATIDACIAVAAGSSLELVQKFPLPDKGDTIVFRAALLRRDEAPIHSKEVSVSLKRPGLRNVAAVDAEAEFASAEPVTRASSNGEEEQKDESAATMPNFPPILLDPRQVNDAPAAPSNIRHTEPLSEEEKRRDAALVELQEITAKLDNAKADILTEQVAKVRLSIDGLKDPAERDRIHDLLDAAILESKVRDAALIYERALHAFQSELYERTIDYCRDINNIYQNPPRTRGENLNVRSQTLLADVSQLMSQAKMAVDPALRYQLTGIAQNTEGNNIAFLNDRLTGKRIRLDGDGDLEDWKVTEIAERHLLIKQGRREIKLTVRQ